ncbi:MAG: hypothetical protein H6816_05785 [Phycisphaerales bacterium]|nr:hypothetical protein [Phycisphaerales bacterium]
MLVFDAVAIDPPRAPRWEINTAATQLCNRVINWLRAAWNRRPNWFVVSRTDVPWTALAWSLIPGMPLIRYGRKRSGYAVIVLWLTCIAASLATLGRAAGSVWLTLAVLLHTLSILILLSAELALQDLISRAAFGALLFAGVRFLVYAPILMLARGFYVPLELTNFVSCPLIGNGDVLLYEGRWFRPDRFNRGDVVFYRIRGWQAAGLNLHDGYGLDRIIGAPGDRVELRGHDLWVNGAPLPSERQPLGTLGIVVPDHAVTLSAGEYLIFPSCISMGIANTPGNQRLLGHVIRIPADDLIGRVVYRTHPWERFGPIP